MTEGDSYKYRAFISYSHEDRQWGDWLHKSLETYRVPRRLVGRESRDGKVPRRLYPVFRDREELPGSSDLGTNIADALSASRYLVVICSPKSAVSRWVNEEIRTFKAFGRADRVLCLIVDGEPNATDKPSSGKLECFPEAIRYHVDAQRSVTAARVEPIAADARDGRDGRADAKLKLLAGLLGVGFDELKQRDQQRRFWQRVRLGILVAAVLSAFVAGGSWLNERSRAEMFAERGRVELLAGRATAAAVYLARAYEMGGRGAALRLLLAQSMEGVETQLKVHLPKGVESPALNPDGTRAFFADYQNTGVLMDTSSGEVLATFPRVRAAAFSPDGARIAVYGDGRPVELWSSADGTLAGALEGQVEDVELAAFGADGGRLVTVARGGVVKTWDVASRGLLASRDLREEGSAVLSPDASKVAFNQSGKVSLRDVRSGRQLATFGGDTFRVSYVTFDGSGSRIAAIGADPASDPEAVEARLWDAASGKMLVALKGHTDRIVSAAFSLNGAHLATASWDKTARVWETASGNLVGILKGHTNKLESALFRPVPARGDIVVTFGRDKTVRAWHRSGLPLGTFHGHSHALKWAAFTSDGKVLTTTSRDGSARQWRMKLGGDLEFMLGHSAEVLSAQFSPDGRLVATAAKDGEAMLWDAASGKRIAVLKGHQDAVWSVNFSPDGGRLLTSSGDGTARLWDTANHRMEGVLALRGQAPARVDFYGEDSYPTVRSSATFSPDGRLIVTSGMDDRAIVWDAATRRPLATLTGHQKPIGSVRFSADGTQVLTISYDATAKVWDARSGQIVSTIEPRSDLVLHGTFSPRGKHVLLAGQGERFRRWNVADGNAYTMYMGHTERILDVRFSPDGSRILSASADNTSKLWEDAEGRIWPIASLEGHDDQVNTASFSPDGSLIATGSSDGAVRIWSASNGKLLTKLPAANSGPVRQLVFSPDGASIVATGDTAYAVLFRVRLEARSPAEVNAIIRCRVPLHLEGGELVPMTIDRDACGVRSAPAR